MLTFTLAISCSPTSNLPWFMDLTFQVAMQYCSLQHRTLFLSPHLQLGIVFALAPSLLSFWSISPLISSSILGTYWPGEFLFQCPIILPFHTVHGVLKARILWPSIVTFRNLSSQHAVHFPPPSHTRLWPPRVEACFSHRCSIHGALLPTLVPTCSHSSVKVMGHQQISLATQQATCPADPTSRDAKKPALAH